MATNVSRFFPPTSVYIIINRISVALYPTLLVYMWTALKHRGRNESRSVCFIEARDLECSRLYII